MQDARGVKLAERADRLEARQCTVCTRSVSSRAVGRLSPATADRYRHTNCWLTHFRAASHRGLSETLAIDVAKKRERLEQKIPNRKLDAPKGSA